jgi:hypothetical protein
MNTPRIRWFALILAIVPLLFAGCGSAQDAAPPVPKVANNQIPVNHNPPPLDEGWTRAQIDSQGFSIGLPPNWIKFDLSEGDLQTIMSSLSTANPTLASALSGQVASMVAQGAKLYAFDGNGDVAAKGFATNLNLIKEDAPSDMDLDKLAQSAISEMKQQLNLNDSIKFFKNRINVNSGEALRLQYDLSLNMPNGKPIPLSFTQYLVIDSGSAYILTFATTEAEFAQYAPQFDKVAKTLTFLASN